MNGAAGILVAIGIVLLASSGCGRGAVDESAPAAWTAPAAAPSETIITREVMSNAGTFVVTCAMPEPVPLNAPFDLEVSVCGGSDRATVVDGIELLVDGRMPEHRHGMNVEPRVTRRDDGSYDVEGMRFHMPGSWVIHLDVVAADGMVERAQIEVTLE